jgi:tRNA dimethylallyltransferase
VTLIAGPTASGKSALALELATRHGGIVVNADSMQVYAELPILSARPSVEDEARVPHRLYGHVRASEPYSVSHWLEDVAVALAEAHATGLRPIVVGGTGLYFNALTQGLSPVPPVADEVRERWRQMARVTTPEELHRLLKERDPVMARRLAVRDVQRVTRALEVMEASGRSLAEWQQTAGEPLVDPETADRRIVVRPRDELHWRCDLRFDLMLEAGALGEVRALLQLDLPVDNLAMRALGVRPLAAHLADQLSLDEAIARAKAETRQYVKRQETWARRYMAEWTSVTDTQ